VDKVCIYLWIRVKHIGDKLMKSMKYGSESMGNKKIGHFKSGTGAPDASSVKEKTKGGKSAKSATKFKC